MDNTNFEDLLRRYIDGTLSGEEVQVFTELLKEEGNEDLLKDTIERSLRDPSFQELAEKDLSGPIFEKIVQRAPELVDHTGKRLRYWMYAAAAVLLFILGSGALFLLSRNRSSEFIALSQRKAPIPKYDIQPGGNKALLTLGDGSTINLDDSANGVLAQQGNAKLVKLNKGQLAYTRIKEAPSPTVYNTVSTQRGGQYLVILPDGTKVWLNAASSLRFPTAFTGKSRYVVATGEAYFEVAPNKELPFIVQAGAVQVQVLGTQFDVMAYDNEHHINTSLLQGAVKVVHATGDVLLQPGQQAKFDRTSASMKVTDADTEQAIAWKNGSFQFAGADIETVMRQLERWYNVDVVYSGKIPAGHFSGVISRQTMLSQVLSILEINDVHFRIEGRKIIVL